MKKLFATIVVAACAAFGASAAMVDLASLTSNRTLSNGDVAYGTLGGNYKITISAGATVTLSNAVINSCLDGEDDNYDWAGLTCNGDATIILKETNVVATGGSGTPIGAGSYGSCGTVTVDSSLSDDHGSPTRTITGAPPQVWDGDLSTLTADATVRDGTVIHGAATTRCPSPTARR